MGSSDEREGQGPQARTPLSTAAARTTVLLAPLTALPCSLERLTERLEPALRRTVLVGRLDLDLQAAYDAGRDQYCSTRILAALREVVPEGVAHCAAVVDVDLFVPVLTYVFGEAQLGGPCAVVSTFRLREPWLTGGVPDDLLQRRVLQSILHEVGHSLGLHHCSVPECVMLSATNVEMLDEKGDGFCPACAAWVAGDVAGERVVAHPGR